VDEISGIYCFVSGEKNIYRKFERSFNQRERERVMSLKNGLRMKRVYLNKQ
jgi:hypothetical protein